MWLLIKDSLCAALLLVSMVSIASSQSCSREKSHRSPEASGARILLEKSSTAEVRAEETIRGLFNYYWKHDPIDKDIEFLFVCAQIGMPDYNGAECSCYHELACTNCFRWVTAVALESVATYGIYMNSKNYSSIPDTIYARSPYNSRWNRYTYIDDFIWYGMAYLRVYEWSNVRKFELCRMVQFPVIYSHCFCC